MYNSSKVAENIKKWSKDKGIPVGQLLADCGLNKNTLSTMTARGSWISVESLAKIADRLDVSLDLIVGRQKAVPASTTTKQSELLMIFNQLSEGMQDLLLKTARMYLEEEVPEGKTGVLV